MNPDVSVGRKLLPGYIEKVMRDHVIIDLEKCRKITLTMDELLKRQDLNDLRIAEIIIRQSFVYFQKPMLKELDVSMQKLLNSVCFLSNKPELEITSWKYFAEEDSRLPDREVLKQWIEEWEFSLIRIREYTSSDNQLVEQKLFAGNNCFPFSRTPLLCVFSVREERGFLTEHLKSGQLTRFQSGGVKWVFPFELMAHFIDDFTKNAEDWSNKDFYIEAMFDKTTNHRLEKMLKRGICDFRDGAYLFSNSIERLSIRQHDDEMYVIVIINP